MAKKNPFNFDASKAAKEIQEEMSAIAQNQAQRASTAVSAPGGAKPKHAMYSSLSKNERTLVQCRVLNEVNRRMEIYLAHYGGSKGELIEKAIEEYLSRRNS